MFSVQFQRPLLILGGYAQTSHTPGPSQEGRLGRLFLVENGEVLGAAFLLIINDLWHGGFPSREGMKGCVMVKSAGWAEMIFAAA